MKTTAAELASLLGGKLEGDPDRLITGVAAVDEAKKGDVVVAENNRYLDIASASDADCIVVSEDADCSLCDKCIIRVAKPAEAFAKVLEFFGDNSSKPAIGIAPGAVIGRNVTFGRDVSIGANCFVGDGVSLGDKCVLYPNVYIGNGVSIGSNTTIYPGVCIYSNCKIGSNVILHAGVVVGADGFGYTCSGEGLVKFPHIGVVEIGDDVEIGANSTIDRAKVGATVIGSGTKIDNLVHIAHNVKIGSNCVIVALSGIAGSVEIGNGVTLAAQTGVKDHVTIGDGCVVAARGGVIGDLPSGVTVSGFPARDHRLEKRVQAAQLHLPELLERIRSLEREVNNLQNKKENRLDGEI